jgi:hypothetical protein
MPITRRGSKCFAGSHFWVGALLHPPLSSGGCQITLVILFDFYSGAVCSDVNQSVRQRRRSCFGVNQLLAGIATEKWSDLTQQGTREQGSKGKKEKALLPARGAKKWRPGLTHAANGPFYETACSLP